MKRIYLLPNIITAFALACGLFVIFKINMIEPGTGNYEVVQLSTFLLLLAAFADFVDGALARAMHAESEFGFIFDSLADAISFGVAPSVLMLKALSLEQGTPLSFISATSAMIFSLCGVLRLARFNATAATMKAHPKLHTDSKRHFTGLPIPAAAAAGVSANQYLLSPWAEKWIPFCKPQMAITLSCVMIFLGYLMVSRLKFPSLKMLHFRIPSFHLAVLTVIIAIFILYGVLYFFAISLAILAWSYVTLGLTLSLIRLIAGKKSKTLEDFEPEPDDIDHL
jgi:CDP-diacylglycerol--serine O-phosphatidyltransferase